MKLAYNLERHTISEEFELGVLENAIFNFGRSILKVADNLDRHKLSDEFEFPATSHVHFGVTCH